MGNTSIAGLVLGGVLVITGFALAEQTDWLGAFSTPLIVLGLCSIIAVAVIWLAAIFGFGRRLHAAKHAPARIEHLIDVLTTIGADAHSRGVLVLADAGVHERRTLFAAGVQMVVGGAPASEIRRELSERAEAESRAAYRTRARLLSLCRIAPVVVLSGGLAGVLLLLSIIGRVEHMNTLATFGILGGVYAAFVMAAVAQELGDRTMARVAEDELAGILIVEALLAIRSGESGERVRGVLLGLLPPGEHVTRTDMLKAA